MGVTILNRIVLAAAIGTVLSVGMSILTNAQEQRQHNEEQQDSKKQKAKKQSQQQDKNKHHQQDLNKLQQNQDQPPGWNQGKKVGWGNSNVPPGQQGRLSQQRQQQLVEQQQQRLTQYRQHLDQQQRRRCNSRQHSYSNKSVWRSTVISEAVSRAPASAATISPERPSPRLRSAIRTSTRLRSIVTIVAAATTRRINTAQIFSGRPSTTATRKASGPDRQTARIAGVPTTETPYAYQDANYGYNGYYVDQDDYNYYFREGFRRGYEDGYYSRYQYGSYSNGNYSMLGLHLVASPRLPVASLKTETMVSKAGSWIPVIPVR